MNLQQNGSKINVLFFCPILGKGGAEMHLTRLMNYLDKQKFNVNVALIFKGGDYEGMLNPDIKKIYLPVKKSRHFLITLYRAIGSLANVISQYKPDIVFSIMDPVNLTSYFACRRAGVQTKMVFSVQASVKNGFSFWQKIFKRLQLAFIRTIYPKADLIFSLSEGVKKELLDEIGSAYDQKIKVINNIGFEANTDTEILPRSFKGNRNLILLCGRLIPLKGFDLVISALPEVLKHVEVNLWLVGDGPERKKLEQIVADLQLQNQVVFHGFQKNVQSYMQKSDLFILYSFFEGFGNVIIEAMATGLPVISSDCPHGPAEILGRDMEYGVLVPPGKPEVLARKIVELLSDKELYEHLSRQSLKRATDFYPSILTAKFEHALLELVNP